MQCQQCNVELFPGARYCQACGAAVHPACSSCRTVNPPGSNFCFSCGSSLASEAPTAAAAPAAALVCPRCHQRNEPSSAYCYACGLPLEGAAAPSHGAARKIAAYATASPGGFWIRFLAYLIDSLMLGVVASLIWTIVSGESLGEYWFSPGTGNSDPFSSGFWAPSNSGGSDVVTWVLDGLYFTLAVAIWATTAGKRLFRLYVVRSDGSRVGLGRALARSFAYYLSFLVLGIGFLMIAFRSDKRGLHDLICDTVVVRRYG